MAAPGLTYAAGRRLLQRPRPAPTPDTFTYTLNGGSTATVSMTGHLRQRRPRRRRRDVRRRQRPPSATPRSSWNDPDRRGARRRGPKKSITGDILDGDADPDGPRPARGRPPGRSPTADGGTRRRSSPTATSCSRPPRRRAAATRRDFFAYPVTRPARRHPSTDTGTRHPRDHRLCLVRQQQRAAGNSGHVDRTVRHPRAGSRPRRRAGRHDLPLRRRQHQRPATPPGSTSRPTSACSARSPTCRSAPTCCSPATAGARPTITNPNADVVILDDGQHVARPGDRSRRAPAAASPGARATPAGPSTTCGSSTPVSPAPSRPSSSTAPQAPSTSRR